MKRFYFLMSNFFLLVLILLLNSCGGASEQVVGSSTADDAQTGADDSAQESPPTENDEPATELSGEPIKIGGLAPLSAPGTVVAGEAMRDAMLIAAEEINDAGGILGRPLELIIVDTEGLPERGAAVMELLINQENVVAVGGGFHTSVAIAAKDIAHENGIPVVFAEPWGDTVTGDMQREIFRIAPLNSEVSAVDVSFVSSLPGIEKVVIVTENTDFGIPAADNTTNGLAEAGIEAVTFGVDIGTQDFAGIMERVKAEQPDLIIVYPTGESAYNFQQQAADAGIGPQELPMLCGQESLESQAFWQNVPDGNYCFMRRVGLPVELYNDVATSFVAEYSERTGKQSAESWALESYDAIKIIAQAIEEVGSTNADDLITTLESITYVGTLGTITFPYGENNLPADNGLEDKWWHQFPDPAITIVQYQETGQNSIDSPVVYPESFQTGEAIIPGR